MSDFSADKVPCYYSNTVEIEDAGFGNIRLWMNVQQRGQLIPQCEVIIPAESLFAIARNLTDVSLNVFVRDAKNEMGRQH